MSIRFSSCASWLSYIALTAASSKLLSFWLSESLCRARKGSPSPKRPYFAWYKSCLAFSACKHRWQWKIQQCNFYSYECLHLQQRNASEMKDTCNVCKWWRIMEIIPMAGVQKPPQTGITITARDLLKCQNQPSRVLNLKVHKCANINSWTREGHISHQSLKPSWNAAHVAVTQKCSEVYHMHYASIKNHLNPVQQRLGLHQDQVQYHCHLSTKNRQELHAVRRTHLTMLTKEQHVVFVGHLVATSKWCVSTVQRHCSVFNTSGRVTIS